MTALHRETLGAVFVAGLAVGVLDWGTDLWAIAPVCPYATIRAWQVLR